MKNKTEDQQSTHDANTIVEGSSSCVYAANDGIQHGEFVQVIDNASGRIVIQGTISFIKEFAGGKQKLDADERFISVDNRLFFKLDADAYEVIKLESPYVDEPFIYNNYKVLPWSQSGDVQRGEVDFFREYSIDELDGEVVKVVHVLNEFSPLMQTTGSCSGHGKGHAWVTIIFYDLQTLSEFYNVLAPYASKIEFNTQESTAAQASKDPGKTFILRPMVLRLVTKEVGEPGWKALDEFAEYLSTMIDARNRFWNLQNKLINRECDRLATEGE